MRHVFSSFFLSIIPLLLSFGLHAEPVRLNQPLSQANVSAPADDTNDKLITLAKSEAALDWLSFGYQQGFTIVKVQLNY